MLAPEELALFDEVRVQCERLRPIPCTQCSYCMPCPNGVNIPGNFFVFNRCGSYGRIDSARKVCDTLFSVTSRAGACIQCGECEQKCPQSIPISEWMPKVHAVLGEGKSLEQVV